MAARQASGYARTEHIGWISRRATVAARTPWHLVVSTSKRRGDRLPLRPRRPSLQAPSSARPRRRLRRATSSSRRRSRCRRVSLGGPFALALSARSNVYQEFGGGPGQIALARADERRRNARHGSLPWLRAPRQRRHALARSACRPRRTGNDHVVGLLATRAFSAAGWRRPLAAPGSTREEVDAALSRAPRELPESPRRRAPPRRVRIGRGGGRRRPVAVAERAGAVDERRAVLIRPGPAERFRARPAQARIRRSGHQSAVSFQSRLLRTGRNSNGAPAIGSRGTTWCGTRNRSAIARQSRLCRSRSWITPAGSPAARARSSTPSPSSGSSSQTRPSTTSAWEQRMRNSSTTQPNPQSSSSQKRMVTPTALVSPRSSAGGFPRRWP